MINKTLFILDKNKHIIDVLSNNGSNSTNFYDDTFTQEINVASTFEFSAVLNERLANSLSVGNYILFKHNNKNFLFTIMQIEMNNIEDYMEAKVYCESVSLILYNSVLREMTINNCSASAFLQTILLNTDFKVGYVDSNITKVAEIKIDSTVSVYEELIKELDTFEAELDIRIEMKNNSVSGMYIDLYKELGQNTGARFDYGVNLANVTKKEDMSELCTALIGVGKDDLNFNEIEWSIENGDPTYKARYSDFLADDIANSTFGTPGTYIYGIYENQDCEDPYTLINETYKELQKRKNPKVEYECEVAYIDADSINLGDNIRVTDNSYPKPLLLDARVNKIELSFSDDTKNTCSFANYKVSYSKIANKNNVIDKIKDYIDSLGIGKLTLADLAALRQFLTQLGLEKEQIDKLFDEIMNNKDDETGNSDDTITRDDIIKTLEGGLWLGDSRMVSMKKYNLLKIDSASATNYNEALALYNSLGIGKSTSSSSYKNLVSTSNKYKIPTIVKYWAKKFGVDVNLVYAVIMGESEGNPYLATKSSTGGYGIMQCERAAYFQGFSGTSSQTLKFIDGTTKSFYPSYSNMTPKQGGNTTLNGVSVDKNISNQIMFGCSELRKAIDYAKGNIFAGLIAYNMGVGAMYWIVSKYVCDTYGYTFVNKNSINAQSKAARNKIYEVLEDGGFEFADWRQKYINNGGSGTVKNVEGYLKWYKIENGTLPYTYDLKGNKFGYGYGKGTASITNNTELTTTRNKIIDKAKEIVQLHKDGKASYSQYPRTIDDTKRQYIAKGTYVKLSSSKWGYAGSTYNGISTSVNNGKGVIGYDCSSFVSCCYLYAGLKSMYNGNCSAGSIMNEIINNGGKMWLANKEGIKNALPGDCIMFCSNSHVPTQKEMDNKKFLNTHHIGIYLGDDQMAHASKWTTVPNAIKISKLSTYPTLNTAFFIRPKDLIEADSNFVVDDTNISNNITAKCVIGASAYHFYRNDVLLKNVQVGSYSDTTAYPSDVPYIFVHLGVNDPYTSGYSSAKTLLSLLQEKYPNKPIFIAKELHVGSVHSNYVDFNSAIDTFNDKIADYCNEYKNVYQIDISNNLEENGLLKSSITGDGVHLNSKENYEILFNNIKEQILLGSGNDDTKTPDSTQIVNVDKVLKSTQNYYYDTINSLYFKLPSKVENSFYARLKFTTSEDFQYTQSKICYLEGTDCVAGQLVPKPNTTYKIIIMANVNTDIDYKYYGAVTVLNAGIYTDFTDFVGGKKVVEIARTYLNRDNLEYCGWKSTTAKNTPASFTNPAENLSKWYDSARGKDQIDCSTFTKFVYMGLDYDKTPYANHEMTSIKRNSKYSWTFTFPRNAAQQAEYCVKNGWVLHGADLVNYSNLEPGDLIFWDRDSQDNGRYMNCSHVAICAGLIDGEVCSIEVTNKEGTVIVRPIKNNTEDKILFVARPKKK